MSDTATTEQPTEQTLYEFYYAKYGRNSVRVDVPYLITNVNVYCAKQGISLRQFCRSIGLYETYITQLFSDAIGGRDRIHVAAAAAIAAQMYGDEHERRRFVVE